MAPVIQDVDDIDGTTPQDGEEYQAGTTAADDGNDEIGSELMHKISDRIDLIARNVGVLLRYTFVPMVLYIGVSITEPRPSLLQLFLPIVQ